MYDRLAIAWIKSYNLDNVPETVSPESVSRCQYDLVLFADFDVPLVNDHQIIRSQGTMKCTYRLCQILRFLGSFYRKKLDDIV